VSGEASGARSVLSTTAGTHLGAFTAIDWALFCSIGAIWGSSFLLIAIGLDAFEPGLVTWLRVGLGAATLWSVPAARRPIAREDRPRLVAMSVLWVGIPFTLFPLAEQHISSGVTGRLNGALPIFAAVVTSLMLRRLPGRLQTIGLAIGFCGIAAIALPAAGEGSSQALGVAMGLLATVCYGVAVPISTPLTQRYGSLPVMARMLALATVWTAPFGLVGLAGSTFELPSFAAVAVLGCVGTGIAFVIIGRLVARVGSTRASFAIYLVPIVALLLGAIFRDETIETLSVLGIALVLSGAALASRKEAARVG
jgi:drug/metabolite transporter (DMT)-like permease